MRGSRLKASVSRLLSKGEWLVSPPCVRGPGKVIHHPPTPHPALNLSVDSGMGKAHNPSPP